MNYFNISECDLANGTGVRVVLWVAGCLHQCPECHNKDTWDEKAGKTFDEEAVNKIYKCLEKEEYEGITFSGGDPLHPNNRTTILKLAKDIKEKFPNKNIWLYTGFSWLDIKNLENIENIDVIVDGKYKKELSNPSPRWRGSTNQRIIDVKKSLNDNKIITLDI